MIRSLALCTRALRCNPLKILQYSNVATVSFNKVEQTCLKNIFSKKSIFSNSVRLLSSNAEKSFIPVLDEEIKVEFESAMKPILPSGFTLKEKKGTSVIIERKFDDGVRVEVSIELSGSVGPEYDEETWSQHMADSPDGGKAQSQPESEPEENVECRPDVRIRFVKPSGRSITFTCSLPADSSVPDEDEDATLPSYSIDTVETGNLEGYFVYSELFDENVYDHITALLLERGLDVTFQNELKAFCTGEEQQLYRTFLGELRDFCKE